MKCKKLRQVLSLDIIERWLKDSDWRVRTAAMNACNGRDIPLDIIERGLKDSDCDVRTAAMNACNGRDIITRTIDPPEKVYKKCYNDVIVVAHIPDDAHIRGSVGKKCRASKAEIIDIIGDFGGEKVGISLYDGETCYFIGDSIEIDDFNMGFDECAAGFHFFCTEKEARKYQN